LLFLLAAGCGTTKTVSGKVSFQGKPMPAGTVLFVQDKAGKTNTYTSQIAEDGTYTIPNLSPGPVKIAVQPLQPPNMPPRAGGQVMGIPTATFGPEGHNPYGNVKGDESKYVKNFPAKYKDPDTSGLTYTVEGSGSQTHDIDVPSN
jgi:hypothetical protein